MPKENNKMQVDIDTLKKQNVNDLLSIKELYKRIEELGEKITQIKYIDNTLVKKLKKEYDNLKKIILDENIQIKINNDIESINSQMKTITTGNLLNCSSNENSLINDIDNFNNNILKLKNKNYNIDAIHKINSKTDNLHLIGDTYTFIKLTTKDDYSLWVENKKNITFENINFISDYDGSTAINFDYKSLFLYGSSLKDSSVTFRNCNFFNFHGTSLFITEFDNVTISNCNFVNIGATGIFVKKSNNVKINNCKFEGRGMLLVDYANSGCVVSQSEKVIISNNIFYNLEGTATKTEGCNNVIYSENIIDTFSKDGIKVMGYPTNNIKYCKDVLITNNIIKNFIDNRSDAGAYINVHCGTNVKVTNNNIIGTGNEQPQRAVISLNNWNGVENGNNGNNITIQNNSSVNTKCHSLKLQSQDNVIISNNNLCGNMYLADVSNLKIDNNIFSLIYDKNMTYGLKTIFCTGNFIIYKNKFKDYFNIEIENDKTDCYFNNNLVNGEVVINKTKDLNFNSNEIICNDSSYPLNIFKSNKMIIKNNKLINGVYSIRLGITTSTLINISNNIFSEIQGSAILATSNNTVPQNIPLFILDNNTIFGYNISKKSSNSIIRFSSTNYLIDSCRISNNVVNKGENEPILNISAPIGFNTGGTKVIENLIIFNNFNNTSILSQNTSQEIGNITN